MCSCVACPPIPHRGDRVRVEQALYASGNHIRSRFRPADMRPPLHWMDGLHVIRTVTCSQCDMCKC